jgi:hypothetical protein
LTLWGAVVTTISKMTCNVGRCRDTSTEPRFYPDNETPDFEHPREDDPEGNHDLELEWWQE